MMKTLIRIILLLVFIKGGALQCDECYEDEICDPAMEVCTCNPDLMASTDLYALLLQPQLTCMPKGFTLTLTRCLAIKLQESEPYSPFSTCMDNIADTGIRDEMQVTFLYAPWNPYCDSTISIDANFTTYTTGILFKAINDSGVYLNGDVMLNYTCTYPLNMQVSLDASVNPITSTNYITISGSGKYPITMALYRYPNYTGVYTTADLPIKFKVEDIIYIGTVAEGVNTTIFSLKLDTCYFTPTSNASDTSRYDLIIGSCPVAKGVSIIENGVSSQTQIQVKVIKFTSSNQLFLHCSCELCRTGSCAQTCTARLSKSQETTTLTSAGPFYIDADSPGSSATTVFVKEVWKLCSLLALLILQVMY